MMNSFEQSVNMPDVEHCNEKASGMAGTDSSDSSTVDLIKTEEGRRDVEELVVVESSHKPSSFFSTFGLMSVVLMIALDNYIIGI